MRNDARGVAGLGREDAQHARDFRERGLYARRGPALAEHFHLRTGVDGEVCPDPSLAQLPHTAHHGERRRLPIEQGRSRGDRRGMSGSDTFIV